MKRKNEIQTPKGKIYLPVLDNCDVDSYIKEYKDFLDPFEFFSDKLKKYDIIKAKNYLHENLPQYQASLALARLSFKERLSVFKLKKEVSEKIKNTRIDNMPDEIPELLDKPFIIETINYGETLFGDIDSIIGFFSPMNDNLIKIYKENPEELPGYLIEELDRMDVKNGNTQLFTLLFHTTNQNNEIWQQAAINFNRVGKVKQDVSFNYIGQSTFLWVPNLYKTDWRFIKTDYKRDTIMKKNYCRICIHLNGCDKYDRFSVDDNYNFCFEGTCDNLISFITIFNYMLHAENTPFAFDDKYEIIKRTRLTKQKKQVIKKENWTIRYLYIDKTKIKYEQNKENTMLNKEGLVLKEVSVRGHLRHQAYGEKYSKHKWIYIEEFTSSKWIKNNDTKFIVNYE
jgi:hypothetical protein